MMKNLRISFKASVFIIIASINAILAACATPYYGHSADEWGAFSESEKLAIKEDYQLLLDSRRKAKHDLEIERMKETVIKRGRNARIE